MLTILIAKFAAWFLKLLGRGSSLPGNIALRLNKNILKKLKLPETVIAVTGSNGKTSTTELLFALAQRTGKSAICNSEGSNQTEGVATLFLKNCDLRGRVNADIAIIECDERFCQYIFSNFTPTAIVVTNVFRDQLTRNGHNEFVAGELEKGLPTKTILVANGDDPLTAALVRDNPRTIHFGVEPGAFSEPAETRHAYFDGTFCPVCLGRMDYTYKVHNHVGGYHCPSCGFVRPKPVHAVTEYTGNSFLIDGAWEVTPQLPNPYFAYNIAAAFTAAVELLGVLPDDAANSLNGYMMKNDRIRKFDIAGHDCMFLLSKHENSISYDQNLAYAVANGPAEMTVAVIVDQLSRKYVASDMSWLWDIDFGLLENEKVKRVLLSGGFANDVAARLLLAGVSGEKLWADPDLDHLMDELYSTAVGDIFVATCFTDIPKFTKRLREGQK